MKKYASSALVLIAAACWGTTGFFNRMMTPLGFSQSQIFFLRNLIPLVLIGLFMLCFRRDAFRIKFKDVWVFLGSGLLSLTAFGLAYMNAMQEMSLSLAVVLLYTSPIFVVLLSAPLFGERITAGKVAALVMVALGAVCATGAIAGVPAITPKGLALGLTAGFGYALYSIFSRFAFQRGYNSLTVTFYTFLFSSIAVAFVSEPGQIPALITSPSVALLTLGLGVMTCLIPYVCYTKGLEGVENGLASVLATLEIVVSTAISALFFQEPFGIANLVGIILVLAGIAVMNLAGPRAMRAKSKSNSAA